MTSKTRKTVTAVRYFIASLIPVALVWVYELGRDGFNTLARDPRSNPFSWIVLLLGCAQASCQAVGAWMNSDLCKGQLPPIPEGAAMLRPPAGKEVHGQGS